MNLSVVHDVHMTINLVHRLVYFVPEAAEEYAKVGVTGRGGYFGSRVAPLGAASDEVVIATFYNFSPEAVRSAMPGVWDAASPESLQAARFVAARRAMDRAGVEMSDDAIAEARSIIDPVVAGLDLGGKALAAANVAVALPDDPLLALWQQVTVLREWRGDVHIALLVANAIGPCDCMVLQVGTGRFPMGVARASRGWDDAAWAASTSRLAEMGWVDGEGAMTPLGTDERERVEADTDRLCAPIWETTGADTTSRLGELILPIHTAMEAAGTYAALA